MAIYTANLSMIKGQNNMHKMIILLAVFLAGCSYNPITKPKPLLLETELSYGPTEYRQGYNDGCESALASYGNSYQKTFYNIKKTPQYQNNQMYNQVWKDAWNYCYMWLFSQQSQKSMYGDPLF